MTLIFTESFDAQPTTAGTTLKTFLDTKWGRWPAGAGALRGGVTLGAGQTTLNVVGRHGTGIELRGGPTNVSGRIEGLIDDGLYNDTIIVGYACKITQWVSGGTQDLTLLECSEKIAAGDVDHCKLYINAAQSTANTFTLNFARGGVLLASQPCIPYNVWFYFEAKIKIHDTFGLFEVRVDGIPVFYQANIDTRNAGTGIVNAFNLHTIVANSPADYRFSIDDFYCLSGGGSAPFNDFLGDVTIDYVQPTANDTVAWSVTGVAQNWDAVADAQATTVPITSDYVSSNVDNQSDLYVLADTAYPAPSIVLGAATYAYADKSDSGARSLAITQELSGSVVQSSDLVLRHSGNGGAQYCRFPRELAPDGLVWTTAKANSMKVGVKARP